MEVNPQSNGSILNDVKKMLGLDTDYQAFDQDIIIHINSVFSTLRQIGFGPESGFRITSSNESWFDLYGDEPKWSFVKDLVYCKVRIAFDPPQNSFGIDALNKQIDELTWRIHFEQELDTAKKNKEPSETKERELDVWG